MNNVYRLNYEDKEIILVGTAHVSPESVRQVREVIEAEQPDVVAVELCESRYKSISEKEKWQNTDIVKIIREKQAGMLLVNLILSSFQKRIAGKFDIQAGQEMLQGIISAEETGAELLLADRNIQVTFSRIWNSLRGRDRLRLVYEIIGSLFAGDDITEEELEQMKSEDMLSAALNSLAGEFPELKRVLVDERDIYMAEKLKKSPGKKTVAVIGAAHASGMIKRFSENNDIDAVASPPEQKKGPGFFKWAVPALIIVLIASTFAANPAAGLSQMRGWILWNGALSALGAAIALAHPLAILTAFVVAPISSLNPLMAAGWFSGLAEAFLRKPLVKDFESIGEDILSLKGFWHNRVTRILLVVALSNVGSMAGTYIGGFEVVRLFVETHF